MKRNASASYATTFGGWANLASASRHESRTTSLSISGVDHGMPASQPRRVPEVIFGRTENRVKDVRPVTFVVVRSDVCFQCRLDSRGAYAPSVHSIVGRRISAASAVRITIHPRSPSMSSRIASRVLETRARGKALATAMACRSTMVGQSVKNRNVRIVFGVHSDSLPVIISSGSDTSAGKV